MSSVVNVFLLSDVDGLGRFGDKCRVKSGYAQNYLIPKGKAMIFSKNSKVIFEQLQLKAEKHRQKIESDFEEIKKVLDGKSVNVELKTHDGGKLYGSFKIGSFLELIKKQFSIELKKQDIVLPTIKEIGTYKAYIRPTESVQCAVELKIISATLKEEVEKEKAKLKERKNSESSDISSEKVESSKSD